MSDNDIDLTHMMWNQSEISDALDWLRRSRDSKSPSVAQLHATTILAALDRLVAERDEAMAHAAKSLKGWNDAVSLAEAAEAERDRLRDAIESYLLWDPRGQGHMEAHRRLRAALARPEGDTSESYQASVDVLMARIETLEAERDALRIALHDMGLEGSICGTCDTVMQAVRPGKAQCLGCERAEAAEAERDEALRRWSDTVLEMRDLSLLAEAAEDECGRLREAIGEALDLMIVDTPGSLLLRAVIDGRQNE